MTVYHVTLKYEDEHKERRILGCGYFMCETKDDARECAMDTWWDERLYAASCKPVISVRRTPYTSLKEAK